jgi:hypothetical protein
MPQPSASIWLILGFIRIRPRPMIPIVRTYAADKYCDPVQAGL